MARLLRPYVPLDVRVQVAERQLKFHVWRSHPQGSNAAKLSVLLRDLFNGQPCQLDHDPALENRPFNARTKKYTPDANDPEFLIYRTKEGHRIKTLVRGDGAQLSDAAIARKRKRKERKARRPKTRWPSRPLRSANR